MKVPATGAPTGAIYPLQQRLLLLLEYIVATSVVATATGAVCEATVSVTATETGSRSNS